MRFLILTQYYPPEVGAPQVRLSAFARALMKRGHEVEVVTALPNYPEGRIFDGYRRRAVTTEEIDGVRVRRVWLHAATGSGIGRVLSYLTFSAMSLPGLASMPRPDVVFVESPPPTLAVTGWLMAKRWRVPMILNVSDLWPDSALQLGLLREGATARAMRRLEAWAYRHADFITAVTEGIRKILVSEKGVPAEKILFLPNGVDTELFAPQPYDEPLAQELQVSGRAVILSAGTVGYGAGLDVVLDAGMRVSDQPVTFVIAGAGSEHDRLRGAATSRQLTNVQFIGPCSPPDVARLYSIATAGLTTLLDSPLFEGTRPARTLAAMACAKPVLYSGYGEGASLVEQSGAGVVIPPEDGGALANAVCSLIADPAAARAMGRRGRQFVEANLGWEPLVGAWLTQLDYAMHHSAGG